MSLSSPEFSWNICRVVAHQARDLIFKGKDDSNNAFVTFTLNKNKFATSVLEKTQNPVWNEECEFVIADVGGTLELVVCHSDFLRERFLGRVEISLSGVAATYGKSIRKWYKLQPKKGKEAKKLGDRGQLEVTVQILYREDVGQQQVKGQEKKPALLNILPSPAWRRKYSGTPPDTKRKDSRKDSVNDDYLNDINRELQFNDPAFYSDDSQSVASSMSDDFRTMHHHHPHSHPDVVDQARLQPPTPPSQKPPPSNKFRPGGVTGSARGKGGIGRNVKTALGNISKALSKEHLDKVGVSTPDLRYMSSSLPPTPIHEHQHHDDQHGTSAPDETDSGLRKAGVHLGVASLGGASLAPPSNLNRAVSEESLLKEKEEKEKGDVYSLTTLPRGKHVRRENRHKKAMSACFTLDDLSHVTNKGNVTPDLQKMTSENKEKQRKHSSSTSKYDTLTRQQLVHLVQQQESILSDNLQQIKELEAYIEKLLLRVMVESPDLLDINRPIKF